MLFFRRKTKPADFAPWAFGDVFVLFLVIYLFSPAVGLAGLGTVLVLGAILVEANRDRIWEDYKRNYKPAKDWTDVLHRPRELYNQLNVYFVWPVFFILGLLCIWVATRL